MADFWGHFWAATQAFGSVVAVGAAAYIGVWQGSEQRKLRMEEGRDKARALAARLLPLVTDIRDNAERVSNMSNLYDYGRSLLEWGNPKDPRDAIRQMTIDVAWRDNIYDGLEHLPPGLSNEVASLLYETATYDREITKLLTEAGERGSMIILEETDVPVIDNRLLEISTRCTAILLRLVPITAVISSQG
jgi:hypothetical protein